MSFERTTLPIMSDIIMYHNEARTKPLFPYARQPLAANIGLEKTDIPVQQSFANNGKQESVKKQVTKLITQPKGYSHLGFNVGVDYKHPSIDPRYNLTKYGNDRPQLLNYSTSRSNLLFN